MNERDKQFPKRKLYYVSCAGGDGKPAFAIYHLAPTELHARLWAAREYNVQLADVKAHEV